MRDKTNLMIKIMIGVLAVAAAALVAMIFLFPEKQIIVPDFSTSMEADVVKWASENKVEVAYENQYSETVEKKYVISQSIAKDTELKKDDKLKVVISMGSDPNLEVELPDFTNLTFKEIEEFVKQAKLQDVSYEYENSDTVKEGGFISLNTTEKKVKRSDMLIFKISLGAKKEEKTLIEVPDFSGYTRNEASSWGNANKISVKFSYVSSNTVEKGDLVKQSVAPKSMIEESSSIVLTYSLGKPVEARDFTGKKKVDVLNWLEEIDDRVKVSFEEIYSDTVEKNVVISSSPKEGTLNDGSTIRVTISLGKPELDDYVGKNYEGLQNAVKDINSKGGKITLNLTSQESDTYSKDLVISQSAKGPVATDATINAVYSTGKYVVVGDFSTVDQLLEFCITNGLNHKIGSYRYSDSIAKGGLVSYDHKGEKVVEGSTITYVESLGTYTVGNFVGKSRAALEEELNNAKNQGAPAYTIEETQEYDNSTNQPVGVIFKQEVSGTTVKITVSKGQSVTIINFVGSSRAEIEDKWKDKLTLKFESAGYNDSYPAGVIVEQSIAVDEVVPAKTEIVLKVSEGKKPETQMGIVYDFADQYKNGDVPAEEIKNTIWDILVNQQHFTNVTVNIGEYGGSKNTVTSQNVKGRVPLDTPIIINIQQ